MPEVKRALEHINEEKVRAWGSDSEDDSIDEDYTANL